MSLGSIRCPSLSASARGTIAALVVAAALLPSFSCQAPGLTRGVGGRSLVPGLGPETEHADHYERKVLVAVGIDAYDHVDRLRHAVGDARAVVELFRSLGFETEALYDGEATKERIMARLEAAVRGAGPEDLVVFFFAGHGLDQKAPDESVRGYLVPVDGRAGSPGELVPMDWLQIDLVGDEKVRAKHLLFLLDACSSGIVAARSTVNVDPSLRNYISELMKRNARQVITAGTGNEQVLDGGYQGHSIFAGFILQGLVGNLADLNSDYHVTATELGLYLSQQVFLQSRGAQKPDFAKLLGTRGGEVVLKFPDERQQQILEERSRERRTAPAELVVTVRPVAADILIYDLSNNLVAREERVSGRSRVHGVAAGDYQVVVRSRDQRYDSVMMVLGIYGPVAKEVTLPRQQYRDLSVPLL